ncbi:MAG: peptidase M14, partial [Saprospiraceae bacterium]|nr:peptidase M14 [Saprospiraceae bacterium]
MKKLLFPLLCGVLSISLSAQIQLVESRFAFEPELPYDAAIPVPEAFLGYKLGEDKTLYANTVAYFKALDAASEKVSLNEYGKTYEGRALINVVITSPENHKNIATLRQNHLKLTDPAALSKAEADQLIESQPVFTSMSYNIHGNEASSTEAVMQVAYRLAAATDAATKAVLDNSVIILYICVNPDGRDRYIYWYKSVARNVVAEEPSDLEHYEPWPNGRTNHYWFDLNRDWIWGVHPEMRGLTAEYQKWMPQVHVDYHEQGYNSNYFTMPGTTPRNLLLPDRYEAWSDTFGMANVRAFDKHRINYFTREAFDFFYPGYGSSYPSVQGAIGMLTEQGGIGGGRAVMTEEGTVQTFRQRIFDHYTTSIATIFKSAEHRRKLLRYSYDTWSSTSSKSPVKAYVLPAEQGGYLEDVIDILLRQGIRVEQTTGDFNAPQAFNFRTGKAEKKTFAKGAYLISTDQPRHLLLNSVMERSLAIEDSVMYDISTWSAPLAYNLDAYYLTQKSTVATQPVKAASKTIGQLDRAAGYAYLIDWNQRHAPKALALLWQKGYKVRAAEKAFSDGKNTYSPGSLIVLCGANLDRLSRIERELREIATTCGVVIRAHDSGRMLSGYDLASSSNRPLKQPKVALLTDPPFDALSCGQIYFLFDQETQLPVQRIRSSVLKQTALPKFGQRYGLVDLKNYDVLILPGGGDGLDKVFAKDQLDQLREWVSSGGVLVASESAAGYFTDQKSKFTKTKMPEIKRDSSNAAVYLSYADREDFMGKKAIPGAALLGRIDNSHPLAFGVSPDVYMLQSGLHYIKPDPGLHTVGYYHKNADEL